MKNSKTAWIIFKRIIFFLFILYLINYFMVDSSYYKNKNSEKAALTQEKILEFEDDIKNNKNVDIKDYFEEQPNNSNTISNLGYKTSEFLNDIVTDKVSKMFQYLSKLFS